MLSESLINQGFAGFRVPGSCCRCRSTLQVISKLNASPLRVFLRLCRYQIGCGCPPGSAGLRSFLRIFPSEMLYCSVLLTVSVILLAIDCVLLLRLFLASEAQATITPVYDSPAHYFPPAKMDEMRALLPDRYCCRFRFPLCHARPSCCR